MYPDYVEALIKRLEDRGHEAFAVGGGLRDALLGRTPNDFDLATSATPAQMAEIFSDMRTIPTGIRHGTLTVLSDGNPVEITTYRVDEGYEDSRHPTRVSFTPDIHKDLARRDFTVNALAYNKRVGLIDDFGGQSDLENKILRAVGDPVLRMREDALRIMRALRFSAQLGFEIENNTEKALAITADGLDKISAERKAAELEKLVCAPFASGAARTMCRLGISKRVLCGYSPSEKLCEKLDLVPNTPAERLALILWESEEGEAKKILKELKYSNALTFAVLKVLRGRKSIPPKSDAEIRGFLVEFGELAYSISRIRALVDGKSFLKESELSRIEKEGYCKSIGELAIDGNCLIELGFSGKEIGELLSALFALVTAEPSANTRECLIRKAKEFIERR